MKIRADSHVHLYPVFPLAATLSGARRRLAQAGGGVPDVLVLLLTERSSEHVFRALRDGTLVPGDGLRVEATSDADALRVTEPDGGALYLVAGRQIVTRERLEALALTVDAAIPDGLPLDDTLAAIRAAGAVPVLPWSPGKWTGPRGARVRDALESSRPGDFLIGDPAMRPAGVPEPALFRLARERGLAFAAGSDPLPVRGDEAQLGRYAMEFEAPFDPARPATSLRAALIAPGFAPCSVGRRCGLPEAAVRWLRNELARRRAA